MSTRLIAVILVSSLFLPVSAEDSPQFRGPDRSGIFAEKGLLKVWPDGGPSETWSADGLGEGYASVAVVDGRIYTSGSPEQTATVFAFDLKGKLLWKKELGKEHPGGGYPGARSTPTVDGDRVYVYTSNGLLACLSTKDGSLVWQSDTKAQYSARQENDYFGMAEAVLIDGDKAIVTPGSKDSTMLALNKIDGSVIWKTKTDGYSASFCSARIFENGGQRQIVTMVDKAIIGVDAASGELQWSYDYPATYHIHAVSPVFDGRMIYVSDGYGQGGAAFEVAEDGKSVKELWTEKSLDIHHGGAVSLKGHIYGSSDKGVFTCLDFKTGEIKSTLDKVGKGATVFADGLLYCYSEKGLFSLVDPNPSAMKVISSFHVKKGSAQHWAHPVISNGVLYVRHGGALIAYNVKGK